MSCNVDFVITKGVQNIFILTVKADNSTLPMQIEPSDTFEYKLINLKTEVAELEGSLTVEDTLSGKVSLTLSIAETNSLISEKGSQTDRFYLRPTYKLVLLCNTVNNGNFLAKVHEVYVD